MQETNQILLKALKTRYATKVFDADKKIDKDKFQTLLETLPLTPSAINSQPWHVFIVRNQQEKQRLAEAAMGYNRPKYTDADYLFIFCAKTNFTIEDFIVIEKMVATVRNTEVDEPRIQAMSGYISSMDNEEIQQWTKKQVYIMLGQFLASCALLEIDSCPIEGFDPEKMDDLLNLADKGLSSVVTVATGYRSKDDFNQLDKAPKARFQAKELITIIE